jgi:hypothetical protein
MNRRDECRTIEAVTLLRRFGELEGEVFKMPGIRGYGLVVIFPGDKRRFETVLTQPGWERTTWSEFDWFIDVLRARWQATAARATVGTPDAGEEDNRDRTETHDHAHVY